MPLDLDELMQRIRAEVQARKLENSGDESAAPAPPPAARYNAAEMLKLPDAEFVRTAYCAVLGRDPAQAEFTSGRDRLLTGEIRQLQFLKQLMESGEARGRHIHIDGLSRALTADWIEHTPPVRFIHAALLAIGSKIRPPRLIRKLKARVERLEQTCGTTAAALDQTRSDIRIDRAAATANAVETQEQLAALRASVDDKIAELDARLGEMRDLLESLTGAQRPSAPERRAAESSGGTSV